VPGDHVCVTPAARSQAQYDNSQADSRRASVQIGLSHWYPPPSCSGGSCQSGSNDSLPHITVSGDHFNVNGKVWVGVYALSNGHLIAWYTLTATPHNGRAGGSFDQNINFVDCSSLSQKATPDSFIQSYDYTSGRWSNVITVATGCPTL
jgi:hypothetical protein